MNLEYLKYRQKQWQKKMQREAKLKTEKEAARIAKIEAEAREQEEIAARKRLLLEQQEAERLHQRHIQRKEEKAEQKWDKQLDILLAQIKDQFQKDNKLEEIETIMQSREPALQELDWAGWLADPLNQRLAALDFDYAMEMFKRDNLLAKQRYRTRPHPPRASKKKRENNYILSFSGNGTGASRSYATTNFNPDDFNLNLGFTVSYWVRPDEVGNTMFAFGRKHNNDQRFTFGINRKRQAYFSIGKNQLLKAWVNMDTPLEESLLVEDGSYFNLKTDGTWYHFVVTYDDRSDTSSGADRKLYVNGVLRQTDTFNWSDTGGSTGGIYFGGRNLTDSYNNGWACALDQLAIFNTAKDAAWVARAYDANRRTLDMTMKTRWGDGLVGYWKFNEPGGITIRDYSGNNNHGTFGAISGDTTAFPTWERL